ncbi:MAG: DUF1573 domain-containing protein [Bacteroidetes bacterium]|nr:DUF1573 domain-containing protein [Bacteroidota bacterium]
MRSFATLIIFLLTVCNCIGQDTQQNAKPIGPEIEFVVTEIDYGIINRYDDGKKTFIFKNTGIGQLILTHCAANCGCTVPKCPTNEPINPGKKGRIEIIYDTKRVGPFSKAVTVKSNAVTNQTVILRVRGEVIDPNANTQNRSPVPPNLSDKKPLKRSQQKSGDN